MANYTVEIHISDACSELAEELLTSNIRRLLQGAARTALRAAATEGPGELSVVITNDEAIQELNAQYRAVDAPTDVLAFANEPRGPFVSAPGIPRYLGDVVISLQRAQEQALEAGHALEAEMTVLVVHGVLHLLGFDDQVADARAAMWKVQTEVLESLDIDVHPPI
jgi:probable rRNA maturation factor